MKLNKILKMASAYKILCEASIRSDMAQRIMHSILPSVVPLTQVEMTEGAIDYNSLNYAIEGRKKIIEYGLIACKNEMKHCLDTDIADFFKSINKENILSDKINFIQKCIESFSNDSLWEDAYGGYAWEKIAKSLKRIIELDTQLDQKRVEINNPNYNKETARKEELNIMRQTLMELNIFDGLVHNTGGIMGKIVDIESSSLNEASYEKEKNKNIEEDYNKSSLYDIIGSVLLGCTKFLATYNIFFANIKKDKINMMNDRAHIIEKCLETLSSQKSRRRLDSGLSLESRIDFNEKTYQMEDYWFNIMTKLKELNKANNQLSAMGLANDVQEKRKLLLIINDLKNQLYSLISSKPEKLSSIFREQKNYEINERAEEQEKVSRLMDAKELNDPIDVYKEIESTLRESGDIHKFKDYVTKLRNHPNYVFNTQKELEIEKQLFFIEQRKIANTKIPYFNNQINYLKGLSTLKQIRSLILTIIGDLEPFIYEKDQADNIIKFSEKENSIYTGLEKAYNEMQSIRSNLNDDNLESSKTKLIEKINLVNSLLILI